MKNNLLNFYWHPFLIAQFMVIFLFAHNIAYVPAKDVHMPIIVTLLFTLIVFGYSKLLLRENSKASILASATLISFFTYGAVYAFLHDVPFDFIRKHSFLVGVNFLLLCLVFWFLFRLKNRPVHLNRILNVFSIILFFLPISQLLFDLVKGNFTSDVKTSSLVNAEWQATITPEQRPDILYLILDGYGRKDVFKKYYALDNQPFLDSLQQEGFQIATKSTSNYCRTAASVASSLNLNYIQNIDANLQGFCFVDLEKIIEDAALLKFLVKQDYDLYSFASGYVHTELTRHVKLIKPYDTLPLFHYMVLNKTPYIIIRQNALLTNTIKSIKNKIIKTADKNAQYWDHHRDMLLYSLSHVHDLVGKPKPSFIFADILVSHPPFIFDRNGNYLQERSIRSLADGDQTPGNIERRRKMYIEGCREQTIFLNTKILTAVRNIKKKIKRPTIIILQGDHGPGAYFNNKSLQKSNIEERFSNLTAVYFSKPKAKIPDKVSPVNIFRFILNNYFGTRLPILPDKQFYCTQDTPCDFIDVTQAYKKL